MSSPSPKTNLEPEKEKIKYTSKNTSNNIIEANLINENRKLNDTIVSLSNKQNDLLAAQNQLKFEIETKEHTIAELTNQMNNFVNSDNISGDELGSLKNFNDNDTHSVKSSFSGSMYSINSLLNNDNESTTGSSGVNVDSKKMLSIVVNQRDLLKQKLKNAENQIVEQSKQLEKAYINIDKLKDKLNFFAKTQSRQSSLASKASFDMESQIFKHNDLSLDFSDTTRADSFSRRYSHFEEQSYLSRLHRYISNHFLKDSYKRGIVINYFILLHLIILFVIILHPLKQQNGTVVLNKVPKVDVSGKPTGSNLPPTGGNVMHAPGKGNAEQAAKNNII